MYSGTCTCGCPRFMCSRAFLLSGIDVRGVFVRLGGVEVLLGNTTKYREQCRITPIMVPADLRWWLTTNWASSRAGTSVARHAALERLLSSARRFHRKGRHPGRQVGGPAPGNHRRSMYHKGRGRGRRRSSKRALVQERRSCADSYDDAATSLLVQQYQRMHRLERSTTDKVGSRVLTLNHDSKDRQPSGGNVTK